MNYLLFHKSNKLTIALIWSLLFSIWSLSAQTDRQIEGTVFDQSGIPLPGASVTIKGTSQGTSTDFDGHFALTVTQDDAILVVSYMGFVTQEISVDNQTQFTVNLQQNTNALSEVIVVGYGETTKEDITTAVSTIDASGLKTRPVADVGSALQGLSPGLNITRSSGKADAEPRINIRGFTSINGGEPLVLIDGIEGDLSRLNPSDIASISVLKDAGAAAIYGARGAFGVVLVETKQAKAGKINVNISSSFTTRTPTMNTDFLTDPYRAVSLVDEAFRMANGVSYTGYTEEDMQKLLEVSKNPALARVEIDQRNGREQYIYYGHTDWWKTFFRDYTPSRIHNVSVSGGTEKLKAYFSYRNYSATGILKVQKDTYTKNNLRGKIDFEVTDWLDFSNNIQYNNSKDLEHGGSQYGYRDIWGSMIWVHALPSYMPTNPDGSAVWRTELNNYTVGDGSYAALLQGKSKQGTRRSGFSNIATLTAKPLKGLILKANYAYRQNNYNQFTRSTKIPYSIYPGIINTFGTDQLTEVRTESRYNAFNIYGEYQHTLGNHNFKATLGFNQESYHTASIQASTQNLISDDLNSLGLGADNPMASGNGGEWALRGVFYRLNYDYKNKYLLGINGRYDATSRFPKDYRWGFFPSVSAGWLINKEDFFKELTSAFDMFKLRASYGSLGNQNIDNYAYYPTLPNGVYDYVINGKPLYYIESPALNPSEITWEEVSTLNLGIDLSLLNNRLGINFDWFQRDTKGMLTEGAMLPGVLGAASPLENAADLRTKGFELALSYRDHFELGKHPFHFSISGNLSNSITKITRFDNPNQSLLDYYEGMTIGELWGYHIDGLFSSPEEINNHADQSFVAPDIYATTGLLPGDVKYIDLNGDGVINEGENTVSNSGDKRIVGNSAPQYLYSFKLTAEWNGFDFSAFFQGVGKQDWYPNDDSRLFWAMYNRPYNSFIRKDLANNIWSPENPGAYFPRLRGYEALSGELTPVNDRYLQSVAYLRLKNLTLGYTFPDGFISKNNAVKLRLFISGENLLTFTNLTDYIDPEAASNAVNLNHPSTSDNRSTAQTTPFSKIYSAGFTLQF